MTAIAPVVNHLWQSTLFALAAALLALTLRRNRAEVRYMLWLAASVKFLVPFAALLAIGGQIPWRTAPLPQPDLSFVMDVVSEPFGTVVGVAPSRAPNGVMPAIAIACLAIWFCGCAAIFLTWWARWRRVAAIVREATPVQEGRALDTLRQLQQARGIEPPIGLVSSTTSFEPGVFGIVKPVLLWPRSIADRLDDRQIEAVLAHEVAHVRRRDNLAATIHMLVEAIFWFHPLVWWIGARLVDERERACDEEVLRFGGEPQVYAEGILETCKFYVESPLACVAGVTGSDLKKRIERIMLNHAHPALSLGKRLLLGAAGVVAIAGPLAIGTLNAPRLRAQAAVTEGVAFATATVTLHAPGDKQFYPPTMADGRFSATNMPLQLLIANAYPGDRLEGEPAWFTSSRFDIEATAPGNPSKEQMWAMVRTLLKDRFKLATREQTRRVPVYALVLAKADGTLGPQVRPSVCTGRGPAPAGPMDPANPPPPPCGGTQVRPARLAARWQTMTEFAAGLSPAMGTQVTDRTGLTGKYDLEAQWAPAPGPPGPAALGIGPTTFTAFEDQLGLKLASEIGPVRFLVIEHIERLPPN
jgi:bla regulator protein BlaR1